MGAVLKTQLYSLNSSHPANLQYATIKEWMATQTPVGEGYRHIPVMANDNLVGLNLEWGSNKEEFQTNINNSLQVIDDISITPPVGIFNAYSSPWTYPISRSIDWMYKSDNRTIRYDAIEYYPSIDLIMYCDRPNEMRFINASGINTVSLGTSFSASPSCLQWFFASSTRNGLGYELRMRNESYGETNATYKYSDNDILTLIFNCHDDDPYYSTTVVDAEPIASTGNYDLLMDNEYVPSNVAGTISIPIFKRETTTTLTINSTDEVLPEDIVGTPNIYIEYTNTPFDYKVVDTTYISNVKLGNLIIYGTGSTISTIGLPNIRKTGLILQGQQSIQNVGLFTATIKPYKLEHFYLGRLVNITLKPSSVSFKLTNYPAPLVNYIDIEPVSTGYTVSLTVSPEGGGQTTGGGSYDAGSPVQITATANNGYVFKGWWVELNGVSSLLSNDREFVIPSLNSDMNITAVFKKDTNPPEDQGGISGPGGGNGSYEPTVNVTPIPDLPLSPASSGMYNIYTLTQEQLGQFSSFLHGSLLTDSSFETLLNDILKWGGDVSTAIIRSGIIPINPLGVSDTIHLSNGVDTLVPATRITSQVQRKDMGTIEVKPYWNSALDYSPYTKAEIYLPFIGSRPIDPDLIMGKTLGVSYIMDILSGNCVAYITAGDNVLYQFNGNILTALPITGKADNIGSFITSALSAAIGIGTANPIMATAGVAGAVATSKPNITRTGDMSSNVGRLGIHTPVLYLTRLKQNLPAGYNKINGYPSNISARLGSLTGYTKISSIHIDGIPASREELDEIETMLKGGVIL